MKRFMGLITAGIMGLGLVAGTAAAADKVLAGFKGVKTDAGAAVTSDALKEKGKKMLFVVAQTACSQCQAELKEVAENYDALKAKADVYVVLVDMNSEFALKRYKDAGYTMPVLLDQGFALPAKAGVLVTPATIYVDADLTVKWAKTGYSAGSVAEFMKDL